MTHADPFTPRIPVHALMDPTRPLPGRAPLGYPLSEALAVLREADVVLAVDATAPADRLKIVKGKAKLRRAARSGRAFHPLKVCRVELDLDTDEYEWLVDAVRAAR